MNRNIKLLYGFSFFDQSLGILFSIAFVFLLLPLVLREMAPSPADGLSE